MEFRKVEDSTGAPPARSSVEDMSQLAAKLSPPPAGPMPLRTLEQVQADMAMKLSPPATTGQVSIPLPREVRLARYLWAAEYHASGVGMVDWWLSLDQGRKDFAAAVLRSIMA